MVGTETTVDGSVLVPEITVVGDSVCEVSVCELDVVIVWLDPKEVEVVDEIGAGEVTEGIEYVVFEIGVGLFVTDVVPGSGELITLLIIVVVEAPAEGVTSAVTVTVTF